MPRGNLLDIHRPNPAKTLKGVHIRAGYHYYLRLKLVWEGVASPPHIWMFGYGGWVGFQAIEPACRGHRVL
jgi:hypothetical protein